MDPRPPGAASTTWPSRRVRTRPDAVERMMKVEPGQGIEDVEAKVGMSAATEDGGVVAATEAVELSPLSWVGL